MREDSDIVADIMDTLMRAPHVRISHLVDLLDIPEATVTDNLAWLRDGKAWVERVPYPGGRGFGYCLTGRGVAEVARQRNVAAEALCAWYRLSRRALLDRLPILPLLNHIHGVLVQIVRALYDAEDVLDVEWQSGPICWRRQTVTATLDGQIGIQTSEGSRWMGVLVEFADQTDYPLDALVPQRFATTARLRILAALGEYGPPMPPVLVLSNSDQGPSLLPLGSGVVWASYDALQQQGVLGEMWHVSQLENSPPTSLLDALPLAGSWQASVSPLLVRDTGRYREEGRLDGERAIARRREGEWTGKESVTLMAACLTQRVGAIAEIVGRHPLMDAAQIARAYDPAGRTRTPHNVQAALTFLVERGVLEDCAIAHDAGERVRYALTSLGLRVLAARAALSPIEYAWAYGILEDNADRTRKGLNAMTAAITHTDGINEVFLAFLETGVSVGALIMDWRPEYVCRQHFIHAGHTYVLSPDATIIYGAPDVALHLHVEYDRSTRTLEGSGSDAGSISDKLRAYYARQARLLNRAARTNQDERIRLLLVCEKSDQRGRNILALSDRVAAEFGLPPLYLYTTTLDRLKTQGPLAPIWYDETRTGMRYLDPALARHDAT